MNEELAFGFYTEPDLITGDQTFIAARPKKCPFCPHKSSKHDTYSGPSCTRIMRCTLCDCEYVS